MKNRRWRAVRRLLRANSAEVADLVAAQWAVARAQWSVWTRPSGRLLEPVGGEPAVGGSASPLLAPRLASAVRRAADYGLVNASCLVRAIALQRMLERRGVTGSRVRVGVQRVADDFTAHAWVELEGQVLGEHWTRVSKFSTLADFHVADNG